MGLGARTRRKPDGTQLTLVHAGPDRGEPRVAERGASTRTARAPADDTAQLEIGWPRPAPVEPPRTFTPILPFFGVLLRGRDAGLFTPSSSAPAYHPSVGYARDLYAAVATNAVVDAVGFTVLFHGYLATVEPRWVGWGLAALLALLFSLAFGTFAASLVRRPLAPPVFRPRPLVLAGVLGAAAAIASAWAAWPAAVLGTAALAVALGATFGVADGALVSTRAAAMVGVGLLVADPLHEAMFHEEIDRAYRELAGTEAVAQAARAQAEVSEARDRVVADCRSAAGGAAEGCAAVVLARDRADLLVQAITFVEDQERSGVAASTTNTWLLERAKVLEASAVVALLGAGGSGQAGAGPRYRQAVAMRDRAHADAERTRTQASACAEVEARCAREAEQAPSVREARARLAAHERRAERIRDGSAAPGPIDRALALGSLSDVASASQATIVRAKLAAAWFLALVMPALVLAMKITAGSKLDPYLRRRWAGRVGGASYDRGGEGSG